MSRAWHGWYHVTVHVYGSWLRGDPRGWRARHHREHVEGDYRRPPPSGIYERLHAYSESLMTRQAVRIESDLRPLIIETFRAKLIADGVEVIILSLDAKHLHGLARFPDEEVVNWIGRAKKHASHCLRQQKLRNDPGGIWAKRCHVQPIVGRGHQVSTFRYIAAHASRGASVWSFRSKAHG